MIQPQGRAGIRHQRRKFGYIAINVIKRETDPLGKATLIGFTRAAKRYGPGFRICHQGADIAVKRGAGRAQGHIADKFFPDQLGDVGKGAGGETSLLPQ
jgi:hypothetical protein